MNIADIKIQVTMNTLNGNEWIKVLKDDRDFRKENDHIYDTMLDFISYVDGNCGGWDKYVRRIYNYGEGYDYIKELWHNDGLGRDNIFNFVDEHKDNFALWMKYEDDYILEVLNGKRGKFMKFKDMWFVKEDDMFILFCCKFIGYITKKLLNFVDVYEVINKINRRKF